MTDDRTRIWETLFRHALDVLDKLPKDGGLDERWTFGGGTVLMLQHRHRLSRDIDIFVPDPQYLAYLTPRLNDTAAEKTAEYVEEAGYVKLFFPEGEIDFVAAGPLTTRPYEMRTLLGREVRVETSAEIVGKKLKFRCWEFKARDLFDFALVAEREPLAIHELAGIVREAAPVVLERLRLHEARLKEDFRAIDILDYAPTTTTV
jgi:predicted nucleotidyltransferase component of viral defense system